MGNGYFPAAGIDGGGNALLVWRTERGEVQATIYQPGRGWAETGVIGRVSTVQAAPALAMTALGEAVAVWTARDSVLAARYSPETGWDPPQEIHGSGRNPSQTRSAHAPRVAVSASGDATVLWLDKDVFSGTVWVNRFATR